MDKFKLILTFLNVNFYNKGLKMTNDIKLLSCLIFGCLCLIVISLLKPKQLLKF